MSNTVSNSINRVSLVPDSIIAPRASHLHSYPDVQFPVPQYVPVPGKSGLGLLAEDLASGAEMIGNALASFPVGGTSDAKNSESQSKGLNLRAVLPINIAAAAGASLAAAGVLRSGVKQLNLVRQNAIEENQRIQEQVAFSAELLQAEADIRRANIRNANEDALRNKQEDHSFIIKQQTVLQGTKLQAFVATLEAEVQMQKNRDQAQITLQRNEQEHEEKQMDLTSRLVENNQQLTAQFLQRSESISTRAFEAIERMHVGSLKLADRTHSRSLAVVEKMIERLTTQNQPNPEKIDLEIEEYADHFRSAKFRSFEGTNRCLDGLSLFQLFSPQKLDSAISQHLRWLFEANRGLKINDLISMQGVQYPGALEFFGFVIESMRNIELSKSVRILNKIFSIYLQKE